MVDTKHVLGDNADYDSFKAVMKDLIGCDENTIYEKYPELVETKCHFPIPDVYADVDAANIFELLTDRDADGESLGGVLKDYYSKGYRNRFTQFKANSYDEVNAKQFTETHGGENAYMALKETGVVEEVIDAGVCPMVVLLVELANSKKGECFIVWPLFKYDIVQNEQKVTKWYKFNAEESSQRACLARCGDSFAYQLFLRSFASLCDRFVSFSPSL